MPVNRDLAGSAVARARHHEPHLRGRASAAKRGAMLGQVKQRREFERLQIMFAIDRVRPVGASEELLLSVVQGTFPDATPREVHLNIEYLAERKLVELRKETGVWVASDNGMCLVAEFTNPKPGPLPALLAQLLTQ